MHTAPSCCLALCNRHASGFPRVCVSHATSHHIVPFSIIVSIVCSNYYLTSLYYPTADSPPLFQALDELFIMCDGEESTNMNEADQKFYAGFPIDTTFIAAVQKKKWGAQQQKKRLLPFPRSVIGPRRHPTPLEFTDSGGPGND